jgi:probable F420-dependent oxidoreductase
MKIGFWTSNLLEDVPPAELGQALEERGFESLWVGEHQHIPAARKVEYDKVIAGRRISEMPETYARMMDPLSTLLLAGQATSSLRIGTSCSLPLEHNIFDLAKRVSTVDQLTGGRLIFGVGAGWNKEELETASGIRFADRFRALADLTLALHTLWRDDPAEHHGEFFAFDPVWSLPKPLQTPSVPIYWGVGGDVGIRYGASCADGWLPSDSRLGEDARTGAARYRRVIEAAGRDPATVPITVGLSAVPDASTLETYREIGFERVIVINDLACWGDAAGTLRFLDSLVGLVAEFGTP